MRTCLHAYMLATRMLTCLHACMITCLHASQGADKTCQGSINLNFALGMFILALGWFILALDMFMLALRLFLLALEISYTRYLIH